MRGVVKNFLIFFLIFLLIAGALSFFTSPLGKPDEISVNKLVEEIKNDEVKAITVNNEKLEIVLQDDTEQLSYKESSESLNELMTNYDVPVSKLSAVDITIKDSSGSAFWSGTILTLLLPFLLIAGFIWYIFRQAQGQNNRAMSFGQTQARQTSKTDKRKKTTFADVAGAKEAKEELYEVVDFLKHPKKFTSLGAKIPKGVLLVGAPGTGKTLMAKAVAGEANAPFFNISGSEFVEMFVGVGASRVRDLFKKAKKEAPAIVFIDEIDAVGRQRGAGLGGSHDEREQTLNQILVEMDGFDTGTNVIVIAATNRPDILDPALLRPGRFDRRVTIDEPDINDREAILKVHAKGKTFNSDVNLRRLAERTPGFTGADLANLLNEAAILAARNNKTQIDVSDCFEAVEKVMLGPERKSRLLTDKEKKITAYHEAGHALVARFLPNTDPVHKVSIISRGMAGGYTLKLPIEDKHMHNKTEFQEELAVLLAGHATEKEIFKVVTTGAANDLQHATKLAKSLVTQFGMSEELGPRTYGQREEMIFLGREIHERRDYSENTAQMIDEEINKLIDTAYVRAQTIIKKHGSKLEEIVSILLERETIEREEFESLFTKEPAAKKAKTSQPS
ncbi:MAG: ATP-dependent zinc metalloprotease FtsH [Patescibacteria group bacterium]